MRRFLLGYLLVCGVVLGVAIVAPRAWWHLDPGGWTGHTRLGLIIVAIPLVLAWIAGRLFDLVRPRRLFRGRPRATGMLLGLGVIAAVVAFAAGGLGLVLLDQFLPDPVVLGAASALATIGAMSTLARLRPGRCVYCDYDVRATAGSVARCPECGAAAPTP